MFRNRHSDIISFYVGMLITVVLADLDLSESHDLVIIVSIHGMKC